ncbi:nitroreductase [Pseudohongiella spirulinae]|uniref:NADH dehydrogenase n=1 Tax=Pseudohongiella spirulinae TaxID=1249552 RepID=A0A0S2KBT9_9GAMM|nr:nitroreductase [Pseudohongiella spirulinae]ALO45587.1 NADH dehydrogenase [Pseudohongiella spirulinae]
MISDSVDTNKNAQSEPTMTLVDAIRQRHSVRGYLDKRIPDDVLQQIFELAQWAPSNCNVQPWKVYVASGELRDRLSAEMQRRVLSGVPSNPDYEYRGDFAGEYRTRQVECAVALYSEMGIERHDREGRMRAVLRNYEFFDAPYMAFIGMNQAFGTTVAIDVGMYAQNLMLSLVAHGLHSCPMGTMRDYPDLVREAFELSEEDRILFGLAFGYEDTAVAANRTRTSRDPVSASVQFRSS